MPAMDRTSLLTLRTRATPIPIPIRIPLPTPTPSKRFYSANRTAETHARPPPYDLLFCGTDSFASASLRALIQHPSLCNTIHVLTPPDAKQGWGANRMRRAPVKQLALDHGLDHQDVPPEGMSHYRPPPSLHRPSANPLLLTCSFGHLIPTSLLNHFPSPSHRLNLHPSLLPKLRGAAPLQWTLARRIHHGGITLQSLHDARFDAGRILAQEAVPIPAEATYLSLEPVMAQRAAELLVKVLADLPRFERESWPQAEEQRSFAFKVKRSDVEIRWHSWSARDIEARWRAFAYLYPLSTTLVPPSSTNFPPIRVLFEQCRLLPTSHLEATDQDTYHRLVSAPPGLATYSPTLDSLVIKTHADPDGNRGDGEEEVDFLAVSSIKVQGKQVKPAKEWWRGFRDRADSQGRVAFQLVGAHGVGERKGGEAV